MTKSNYIPASLGQVQPTKLAIRLFFTRILVVVCGGLPAFHRFHCLSSQILVVVCDGLRWFVMVCVGLSYSHTPWLCRSYPCPGSIAMTAFLHASRFCASFGSSWCCLKSLHSDHTLSIHLSLCLPRGLSGYFLGIIRYGPMSLKFDGPSL